MSSPKSKASIAALVGVALGVTGMAAWNNRDKIKERAVITSEAVNQLSVGAVAAYEELKSQKNHLPTVNSEEPEYKGSIMSHTFSEESDEKESYKNQNTSQNPRNWNDEE